MTSTWKMAVVIAAVAGAACTREDGNGAADAGNASINMAAEAPAQAPSPSAEANAAGGGQQTGMEMTGSILAWSTPAAGSTVSGPVDELVFHFTPPARLSEVIITGPDGTTPMMVSAVGEVEHYSLPLGAEEPGNYTVAWRATAQGREHRGSFGFTVR